MKKVYQIPEAIIEDLYEEENLLTASTGDDSGTHPKDLGWPDEDLNE